MKKNIFVVRARDAGRARRNCSRSKKLGHNVFSPGQLKAPVERKNQQPSALSFQAEFQQVEEDRAVNSHKEVAIDAGKHVLAEAIKHY